jgi:hypothetical protein
MKRYLLLIAALTIFTGCKSRKVLNAKIDSTAITSVYKQAHIEESHIDTGSIKIKKEIATYDSSDIKVVIIPIAGKIIRINKDGIFTGEALKVEIINKKQTSTKQTEFKSEHRAINDQKKEDSSFTKRQQISISKKTKSIDAKPNYSWIWWIGGLFVIAIFVYQLYKKLWSFYI